MIGEPVGHYCWVRQCSKCKVTNYGCVTAIYCGSCGRTISGHAYNESQYWGEPGQYYDIGDIKITNEAKDDFCVNGAGI